jgi:diguanylate cyclase (GGDEF)-like protein
VLAGTPVSPAVRRRVSVTMLGRAVGSVTVNVPLDEVLLQRLRKEVGMDLDDRLALVRRNRAIAGPLAQAAAVPPGRAVDRRFGDVEYRVFGDRLVGPPNSVELLALTRRADISDGARDRLVWTVLAILVTLVTVAAVGYALGPVLARRGGPLALLGGRRDARALSLVGDALASTHDPDKLLPVVLHATMEATGAVGGRITQNGRVAAEEGEVTRAGRPLRIELASEEGADEVAVELWPESGAFDERTRALATTLAGQAAIALENARLHGIVQRQAVTDELTQLANRRYFMQTLGTELRRAERFDEPLALVFADLDDFKHVNDRHGHHIGDEVLRAFAGAIRKRVRAFDLAARLGGEEFAVLLPETDLSGAEALAESLRAAVAALEVPVVGREAVRVTASFGIAVYPQTHNVDELMTAADLALYRAKREGKNRVRVSAGESV